MTTVEYKVLFEVRILHDYYLYGLDPTAKKEPKRKSFFAMSEGAQTARLKALLRSRQYDVQDDLEFLLGTDGQRMLRDLHLRLKPTPSGFVVGMEVKRVNSTGGSVRFRPAVHPGERALLTIGLVPRSHSFGAISNVRLDRGPAKIYHFSNQGSHEGRSLSKPIPNLAPGQDYRMGDVARIGGNVHQATRDNLGNASGWEPISGGGLVNQEDRNLGVGKDWFKDWLLTLDPRSRRTTPMGVIRIALNGGSGDFRPIGSDGLLATRYPPGKARPVHPVFELRILSRTTYWRYRKTDGFSSDELKYLRAGAGSHLDEVGGEFVTKTARPIARDLPPLVSATYRIPNAQPGSLKSEGGKLYSEIHFSNLNPVPQKKTHP